MGTKYNFYVQLLNKKIPKLLFKIWYQLYIYIYIYKEGGETLEEAAQKGYTCLMPITIQGQFGPVLEQSDLVKNVPKPQHF